MVKFPHTLGLYVYYAVLVAVKGVSFHLQGWEQLSWLVKKEHLFRKTKFLKKFISLKYTLYRPLTCIQVLFYQKYEVLFFLRFRISEM